MYKDLRPVASTPDMWADNFRSRLRVQDLLGDVRLRRDPRWREIRRRVPAGSRIVDMGSGLGQWVAFLAGSGYGAAGVDYSAPLIATARERHPELEWIQGPMEKVPLPDASVDAVISWGVIEHDEAGPQRALAEFRRLIRPGGHVFVTVPIDTERMRRASVAENGGAGRFFQYFFAPDELDAELRRAGFETDAVLVTSRHVAAIAPRLYAAVARRSPVLRDALSQIARPVVARRPDAACMVMAIGRRPAQ
jgi:ubiquinone/menaquinone biosynthesis C-methylase UbiE